MKYIYQLFIILVVTFVGELLHYFIPIPVPASIYGLINNAYTFVYKGCKA